MFKTKNDLPEGSRAKTIELLNARLPSRPAPSTPAQPAAPEQNRLTPARQDGDVLKETSRG